MNQKNMEALAKILDGHRVVRSLDDALSLAVFLTARGVLVPSAMNDEESERLAAAGTGLVLAESFHEPDDGPLPDLPEAIRAELERIAKGVET